MDVNSSAFNCFVKKRMMELAQVGIRFSGWRDATTCLWEEWEEFNKEQISVFKTEAEHLLKTKKSGGESELEEFFTADDKSDLTSLAADDDDDNDEKEVILKCWKYPFGKTCTAIVAHINHYVDSEHFHIPGELSLAAFNVQDGLVNSLCTLIDPGKERIPHGHSVNAFNNRKHYGLPNPPFSTEQQKYTEILTKIQSFLEKHPAQRTNKTIIFALEKNITGVKAALEWLIQRGDDSHPFSFEVYSLERLIVVLSAGGLECVAERHDKTFKSVYKRLNNILTSISNMTEGGGGMTSSVLNVFPLQGLDLMHQEDYTSLGEENCTRVASLRMEKHPYAGFGVFFLENQVSAYCDSLEYAHLEELACNYHKNPKNDYASSRMIYCALSVAKRLVYLALDVILVNYGVVPIRGKHFPHGAITQA